jgi:hypothetical protein
MPVRVLPQLHREEPELMLHPQTSQLLPSGPTGELLPSSQHRTNASV